MNPEISSLPDNVDSLKEIILFQRVQHRENRSHIHFLEEQIRFFKASLYGRKSEKLTEEEQRQLFLFDEAEEISDSPPSEELKVRKKVGRRPLPEAFTQSGNHP